MIAWSSFFCIAPSKTYLADILFNPIVELFRSSNFGIRTPNKHPMIIPSACAQIGPSLMPRLYNKYTYCYQLHR